MAGNHHYVEFPNYDAALKYLERYKFLLEKYRRLNEELSKLKHDKLSELNSFLSLVKQMDSDLTEFKGFMPKEKKKPKSKITEEPKVRKRKSRKRVVKEKLPKKNLKDLRKGLEQIKKDLSKM